MKNQSEHILETEQLFKENYVLLCLISFKIVKDRDVAKDIVQDFFVSYWKRRQEITLTVSFKSYAIRAVKNLSLLLLEKEKKEQSALQDLDTQDWTEQQSMDESGQEHKLKTLLNKIPESRRNVFISSVVQGMSYSEIAKVNNISINTVKTQIKRAYAFLRKHGNKDMLQSQQSDFEL